MFVCVACEFHTPVCLSRRQCPEDLLFNTRLTVSRLYEMASNNGAGPAPTRFSIMCLICRAGPTATSSFHDVNLTKLGDSSLLEVLSSFYAVQVCKCHCKILNKNQLLIVINLCLTIKIHCPPHFISLIKFVCISDYHWQ